MFFVAPNNYAKLLINATCTWVSTPFEFCVIIRPQSPPPGLCQHRQVWVTTVRWTFFFFLWICSQSVPQHTWTCIIAIMVHRAKCSSFTIMPLKLLDVYNFLAYLFVLPASTSRDFLATRTKKRGTCNSFNFHYIKMCFGDSFIRIMPFILIILAQWMSAVFIFYEDHCFTVTEQYIE